MSSSDSEDSSRNSDTNSDTSESQSQKQISPSKLKRKYDEINSDDDSVHNCAKKKKKLDSTPPKRQTEAEKLLEQFSNQNEYKIIEPKQVNPLDHLTKHDEIYLVQMSKTIDPQLLISKEISFDGLTKLKLDSKRYVWDIDSRNEYDINVMSFTNLIHLKAKGVVTVQPKTKSKKSEFEMKPIVDDLEVPSDINVRHPLFGAEYEERIKLDDDIMRKLDEIVVNVDRKHKKKSKKKDRKKDNIRNDDDAKQDDGALDIIKLLNEHEEQIVKNQEKKKKKKSKHKSKDVNSDITEVENETESILSQILFDIETANKSHKNETSLTEIIDATPVLKKKKKHKRSLNLTEEVSVYDAVISEVEEKPARKSKKSKKHSVDIDNKETFSIVTDTKQSNHKLEYVFASPVYEDHLPKKRKKKHREKDESKKNKNEDVVVNSTMSTSTAGDTILQLDESCIPKVKKKKHKRKDSIDSFIDDLVKDVTSSEESLGHKKKKRYRE